MGLCFIISRGKLQFFARLIEILLIIEIITLLSAGILAGPEIDFDNLYPITTNDIGAFLEMQIPVMGFISLMFMMFFIGSKFNDTGDLKKYGIRSGVFVAILGFLSVFLTVGI